MRQGVQVSSGHACREAKSAPSAPSGLRSSLGAARFEPVPISGLIQGRDADSVSMSARHRTRGGQIHRTKIEIDDKEVPGTDKENIKEFRNHLRDCSASQLTKISGQLMGLKDKTPFDSMDAPKAVEAESSLRRVRDLAVGSNQNQDQPVYSTSGSHVPAPGAPQWMENVRFNRDIWIRIAGFLPYKKLLSMASLSKSFRKLVYVEVQNRLITPKGQELDEDVIRRVVVMLARRNSERLLSEDTVDSTEWSEISAGLASEVVESLVWRDYVSGVKSPLPSAALPSSETSKPTLEELAKHVRKHALATMVLRNNTHYPNARAQLPNETEELLTTNESAAAVHWRALVESGEQKRAKEDDQAARLHQLLNLDPDKANHLEPSEGHNLSVVRPHQRRDETPAEPGQATAVNNVEALNLPEVYSNRELNATQMKNIQFAMNPAANAEVVNRIRGLMKLAPLLEKPEQVFQVRYGIEAERKQAGWGERDQRKLALHSEAQRMGDGEGWRLTYAGNLYPACLQCSAAYYALGRASIPTPSRIGDLSHPPRIPRGTPEQGAVRHSGENSPQHGEPAPLSRS